MSKNLTRKGLAFGALVALAGSVFAGTPAVADANGPITLLPNAGTTFNSIIGAGITLDAVVDPRLETTRTDDADGVSSTAKYIITNPAAAKLTLSLSADATTDGYSLFDANGNAVSANTADPVALTTTQGVGKNDWGTVDSTSTYVDFDTTSATKYVTNATKIVISAGINTASTANADVIASLKIDSTGTSNVALTVQAFTDSTVGTTATLAKINNFENTSKAEAVNLYAAGNVSATTTITQLERDTNSTPDAATSKFVAKTVYSNSINPHQVAAKTFVSLFLGSTIQTLTSEADGTDATGVTTKETKIEFAAADTLVSADHYFATYDATTGYPTGLASFASGVYSAQLYFQTDATPTYVAVGSASQVVDLTNGANATVAGIKVSAVADKDLAFTGTNDTTNAVSVRTGAKDAKLTVLAQNGTTHSSATSVEAANIEVKSVVTATKLSATSSATVSGATGSLAKTGDIVTSYGRTDATGQVDFTVTNAGAKADDVITVATYVKSNTGVWLDATTSTITWADAALSSFVAKDGNYVSGAKPSVTFIAKDQFGQGIDSNSTGKLNVYASAYISGIESKTTYNDTITLSGGKAVFTFANFAAANSSAVLKATLYAGTTSTSRTVNVNVYNGAATGKIAVADVFKSDITYKDYVTGDSSDAAVAAKVAKNGLTAGTTITGTVLNVNNVGQPGVSVEISAPGVLLKAGDIYATDKVTAYANEYGNFSVDVIAHKVNTTGATVTITADGKTATTVLKTYLPAGGLSGANLQFGWSIPALLVKNTTYAVVASLSDKWGNPVVTANNAVTFQGFGSAEINSVSTAVNKDFGKDGKVTVFVRSVKDIAGPGSITATVNAAGTTGYTQDETNDTLSSVALITTDVSTTAWNETTWNKDLTANVEILEKKPTASISKGSKSSTVVVKNANGTTVKVVRGSKATTVVATSNSQKVTLKGGTGTVKVYVNGVKVASK